MTKSGKRRNPFCKRHGSVRTCPLYLDGRFALGLIRHLLQLMHDTDIGLIDTAESGFHTGVFEPIQFSGI